MSRTAIVRRILRPSAFMYLIGGVTAVNLMLAVVSFLKDLSFASYFGTTRAADQVNTAFLLPETISYNLIAAVVGIAAVPALTAKWQDRHYGAFVRSAVRLSVHIVLAMAIVGVALALARGQVFELSGYPAGGEDTKRLEDLYLLLLVTLPLFPIYAVGGAALQASGAFYAAAAGPIVLNGLMLAAIAVSSFGHWTAASGALAYSVSIVVGAAGMAALVWAALRKRLRAEGTTLLAAWRSRDGTEPDGRGAGGIARVYRDMLPLLLLTLFSQAQYAAERTFASNQEPGTLAALNYAYRVSQFPNWVFVAAVTAVLLPSMSRAAMRRESGAARPELVRALIGTLVLMIPASAVLWGFRETIVELLFGRGAFDRHSVEMTSDMLAGYSLSVVGQAVSGILLRYLIAFGRLYGAAAAYLASAAAAVLFDWLALPKLGSEAIGYGSLLGWALNAILLAGIVRRHFKVWRG